MVGVMLVIRDDEDEHDGDDDEVMRSIAYG